MEAAADEELLARAEVRERERLDAPRGRQRANVREPGRRAVDPPRRPVPARQAVDGVASRGGEGAAQVEGIAVLVAHEHPAVARGGPAGHDGEVPGPVAPQPEGAGHQELGAVRPVELRQPADRDLEAPHRDPRRSAPAPEGVLARQPAGERPGEEARRTVGAADGQALHVVRQAGSEGRPGRAVEGRHVLRRHAVDSAEAPADEELLGVGADRVGVPPQTEPGRRGDERPRRPVPHREHTGERALHEGTADVQERTAAPVVHEERTDLAGRPRNRHALPASAVPAGEAGRDDRADRGEAARGVDGRPAPVVVGHHRVHRVVGARQSESVVPSWGRRMGQVTRDLLRERRGGSGKDEKGERESLHRKDLVGERIRASLPMILRGGPSWCPSGGGRDTHRREALRPPTWARECPSPL